MEPAIGAGPEAFGLEEEKDRRPPPAAPLPLAVSLALDATAWARVGVSTAASADVAALMGRGYYRLEILQLALLAERSGKRLSELTQRRDKDESLRDIAKSLSVEFDEVYDRAQALARGVEARLERLDRVWAGRRSVAPPAGPLRPKEEHAPPSPPRR